MRGGILATIKREKFLALLSKNVGNVSEPSIVAPETILSPKTIKLSTRKQEILNLVKSNSMITVPEISKQLELPLRTIERDLSAMQKQGVLVREGTYAGHWKILV